MRVPRRRAKTLTCIPRYFGGGHFFTSFRLSLLGYIKTLSLAVLHWCLMQCLNSKIPVYSWSWMLLLLGEIVFNDHMHRIGLKKSNPKSEVFSCSVFLLLSRHLFDIWKSFGHEERGHTMDSWKRCLVGGISKLNKFNNLYASHLLSTQHSGNFFINREITFQPFRFVSYITITRVISQHEMMCPQDVVPNFPTRCDVEWVDAEDPLFLLYTSGSTGKPKVP